MKPIHGFTLIEVLIFIIVTGLLGVVFGVAMTSLQKTPNIHQELVAKYAAAQCMEWYLGQRLLNGYSSITCPSTSVPAFCTAPSGYTLTVNVSCTTYNSDSNYTTITVSIAGKSTMSLSMMIGS